MRTGVREQRDVVTAQGAEGRVLAGAAFDEQFVDPVDDLLHEQLALARATEVGSSTASRRDLAKAPSAASSSGRVAAMTENDVRRCWSASRVAVRLRASSRTASTEP